MFTSGVVHDPYAPSASVFISGVVHDPHLFFVFCVWFFGGFFSSFCVFSLILPVSLVCSFWIASLGFFLYLFCVLCPVFPVSLDFIFFVFCCLPYVSCAQCCLCLWIVHFGFLFRNFFVVFRCLVPNIPCVSRLFISDCLFGGIFVFVLCLVPKVAFIS